MLDTDHFIMRPLDSPLLKLERAKEHLAAIDNEVAAFLAANPYRTVNQSTSDDDLRVMLETTCEPPRHLALVIGDFVSNLRHSLDHLVWAMLPSTPSRPEDIEFPIFKDAIKYRAASPRRIGLLPLAAQQEIERLQPYHPPDGENRFMLEVLRRLSNIDKHREIAIVSYGISYSFQITEDARIVTTMIRTDGEMKSGDIIPVPDVVEPFRSYDKFKVEPTLAVLFDQDWPGGFVGTEGLHSMFDYICEDVFPRFYRFLDGRPTAHLT